VTGYRAEEIVGQDYSLLYPDDARAQGKPQQDLQATAAAWDGRCEQDEWRARKDGTQFIANVVLTIVRDDAGNVHGYTVVMRDATIRKQAEQEIAYVSSAVPAPRSPRRFSPQALIRNFNQAARTFSGGRRKR
jgi:PAS domain S-box-containing protein